jgi:hypothetical protein
MNVQRIGGISFLIGILIAIIFGVIPSLRNLTWAAVVLMILGVIIGLLNISDRNISLFLIASIAFIAMSTSLNALPVIGQMLSAILTNMVHLVGPAALVVSVVAIVRVANSD